MSNLNIVFAVVAAIAAFPQDDLVYRCADSQYPTNVSNETGAETERPLGWKLLVE